MDLLLLAPEILDEIPCLPLMERGRI